MSAVEVKADDDKVEEDFEVQEDDAEQTVLLVNDQWLLVKSRIETESLTASDGQWLLDSLTDCGAGFSIFGDHFDYLLDSLSHLIVFNPTLLKFNCDSN